MLEDIRARIEEEIEELSHELNVELPERVNKAMEMGDLRENAEYKSALDRQSFIQARLDHLKKRMAELSKIDVSAMPADRVGFGSQVVVHDPDRDKELSLTLVAGDFMDLEAGHVSIESPIGNGLLGAQEGEEVTITLPRGERRFLVKQLTTLPQQLGMQAEDGEE